MAGSSLIFSLEKMVKKFESSGELRIIKAATAQRVLTDAITGAVTGLVVKSDKEAGETTLSAKNVLVATGGYGAGNLMAKDSLIAEYRPDLVNLPTTNGPFATGEGHRLAQSAGAKLIDMDDVQVHTHTQSLLHNIITITL
jgi:succinate dehydrogenase/fumarate reductase flavoprotein subunit